MIDEVIETGRETVFFFTSEHSTDATVVRPERA